MPTMEFYRRQIILGLRDYARRCGFYRAVVGSSGGIDSALTIGTRIRSAGCAPVGKTHKSVIVSIATAGHVPEVFGLLYIIAMLLSIVGEIFARMGLQSQKGGVRGKRISIWLNIVSFVVPVIIILLGRF
jgi:hypothetical protein